MYKSSTFKSKSIIYKRAAPLASPLASLISYQIFASPFFSFSFFLVQASLVQRTCITLANILSAVKLNITSLKK